MQNLRLERELFATAFISHRCRQRTRLVSTLACYGPFAWSIKSQAAVLKQVPAVSA